MTGDGKWLVTGSADKTVRLWEVESGREIRVLTGHTDVVNSVFISADDKWLITADNSARLWELVTGKEVRAFGARGGPGEKIASAVLSDDNRWIATGSWDQSVRLWESTIGKEVRTFQRQVDKIASVTVSPDGKWLVTAGSPDRAAYLWDAAAGKEVRAFQGHPGPVACVAFAPHGDWLITAGSEDKSPHLWDLDNGKEVRVFSRSHRQHHRPAAVLRRTMQQQMAGHGECRQIHQALGSEHWPASPRLSRPQRQGHRRGPVEQR